MEYQIGTNLFDLKSNRIKADYKKNFKADSVNDSKSKANKIFELFKVLED